MKNKKQHSKQAKLFILVTLLLVLVIASFAFSGQTTVAATGTSAQKKDAPKPALIAVVGGTLIDGTGKEPVPNSVILIEGNRLRQSARPLRLKSRRKLKKSKQLENSFCLDLLTAIFTLAPRLQALNITGIATASPHSAPSSS